MDSSLFEKNANFRRVINRIPKKEPVNYKSEHQQIDSIKYRCTRSDPVNSG